MTREALLAEILRLPDDERRALLEAAWESLDGDFPPLTPEQEAEIDRRLAEHEKDPGRAVPWEEVLADLRSRFK